MKLDSITNKVVEQFLKDLIAGKEGQTGLLDMAFLSQFPFQSVAERRIKLFEHLSHFVNETYQKSRMVDSLKECIPGSKTDAQNQISEDFGRGNSKLESLSALYFRYFSQIEFSIEDLAKNANVVPQQFRRRLNNGISILVNELRRLEMVSNQETHRLDINIPMPEYSTLVGVDELLVRLGEIVAGLLPGQIVSVEGMGGIGKTALVHAFIVQESVKQNYNEVLWISARQSVGGVSRPDPNNEETNFTLEDVTARLAQQLELSHLVDKPLEDRLKGIQAATALKKYLLVVDNLETIEDYTLLVPALARYCGNCKILITTRESLREFSYVTVFPIPELAKPFASQLLETEVNRRGRNFSVSEKDVEDLIETVGGLPLALKLIAAQIHLYPIAEIITEFKQAKNGVESIYRFLYWKIWNSLSESSRKLLFTFLTLNPEGEDSEFIALMSDLAPGTFASSLNDLDNFSLIETNMFVSVPKFRIHRLTVTFLQTDILKVWELKANVE